MSGPDKGKLEPDKTLIVPDEPKVPFSQTTDFSVSTNAGMSDPASAQVDVYSTQFADRTAPTGSTEKGNAEKKGSVSDALSSSKNQLPVDIPGFVVESELGRGAFGVVYCARDQFLDRRVAIKKPLISNPAHRQQYIDEARKAVKLDHPSIVPIYQVGMTTNDEPFVVQKLIEGSTLRDMLKNGEGRLPLLQTVSIMRQVCLAVDAAHVAGIVHRDLKPENLLVEPEGRVYVADFGLAILEDDEQNKKGREVAGTPLYMSPEQFAGRVEWLDGRSDIWALGVILYELLSGKTPFSGSSLNELKDQIKNKDPRPIHQRDPKVPSAFDAMFRKCCAKNVGDRYASAREMIAELDAITESLPYLDTINLMSQGRTGSFKGMSSSVGSGFGSTVGSSQGGLTSRGLSAFGSAQNTLRNSMGGSTIREQSTVWKLLGPFLITVAVLGLLTSAAWLAKIGPFAAVVEPYVELDPTKNERVDPVSVDKVPTPGTVNSVAGTTENKAKEPKVEPKPPPSKPFTVSINGRGTHESIAKAIADSEAGDAIRIHAGTYRESLVIDRPIKIVGEGAVTILATESSCMKIQADSSVQIENVTFDCQAAKFNAIDLVGGKLTLNSCVVFAGSLESYNCVKARVNSTFVADKCKFQSTLDVAVSGEINSTIAVRDSTFSFSATGSGRKRIGIQATGAKGLIQRCIFIGPCIGGVDWMESNDQELMVEGCQFDNCEIGIQARACNKVLFKGSIDERSTIKNSIYGVSIKHSQVDVSNVNVEGISDINSPKNRVAMQITEDSKVKCTNCDFSGAACGILVKKSSISIDNVSISDTTFLGMLLDEGSVNGNELQILNFSGYGLAVLSKGASVLLNQLEVEAAEVKGQKISPAVYAASGKIEFKNGLFSNCLCGIFVDPDRELINSTGLPERRSLIDLIGNPEENNTLTPVELRSDRMTLTNCDWPWIFNGAGSSQVKEIAGNLRENRRKPKLSPLPRPEDYLEMDGTDLTNFTVVKKTDAK